MIILRVILFLVVTCFVLLVVDQYFFCPQYNFPPPRPFSGEHLYNPYASADSASWRKCNFHAHDKLWHGITNGKGDASDVWRIYDSLGYAVHCVSNYERIDRFNKDSANFIPTYEHGYGIMKNHQLVLGSDHVFLRDYLFPQTLSNKQNVLNQLHSNDSIVVFVNHPCMRNAYPARNFNYLSNYNCMEVLHVACRSLPQWDSALSAGKPAFIVGDDDVHDLDNPNLIGRFCTWVNVPDVSQKSILQALKTGNEYGMIIGSDYRGQAPKKSQRDEDDFPRMKSVHLDGDTLSIEVSEPAQDVRFMGQGGKMLAEFGNCSKASYVIKPSDTYVRTTIYYHDETEIFLNPILRYHRAINESPSPTVSQSRTILFRMLGCIVLLFSTFFTFRKIFRKKSAPRVKSPVKISG